MPLRVRMSFESDDEQTLKPKELVFILAIAGRIDAQGRILAEKGKLLADNFEHKSKLLAQKLDQDRSIYDTYAVLDSINLSWSSVKYWFDIFIQGNTDLLHEIMVSPGGIAALTFETLFLVAFSFLASRYDKEKRNPVKKFINAAWPYLRDVIKGLKNAYKGWRSTAQALGLLAATDLNFVIIPVGLVLGIIASVNRLWLRYLVEKRKKKMKANGEDLLNAIQKLKSLTKKESKTYLDKIAYQSDKDRVQAYIAMGINGFIDSMYLYVGVLSLAILSNPALAAMIALCAIFTVACVIARIYEEYEYQVRLQVTQTRCKRAIVIKELETSYAALLLLQKTTDKSEDDLIEIRRLKGEVCEFIKQFEEYNQLLKSQTTRSYFTAALSGMKYGLFAYGALTSFLFTFSSLFLMSSAAFPPALLIFSITTGIALMIGLAAYTLISHYHYLKDQEKRKPGPYYKLAEMRENIEAEEEATLLSEESFQQSIKDGIKPAKYPQYFFQEWFEVFRTASKGALSGRSCLEFVGAPLQEADSEGHYHDTLLMNILSVFSSLFFAAVLALRALAKGFGREPLGSVKSDDNPEPASKSLVVDTEPVTVPGSLTVSDLDKPAESVTFEEKPVIALQIEEHVEASSPTKFKKEETPPPRYSSSSSPPPPPYRSLADIGLFKKEKKERKRKFLNEPNEDASLYPQQEDSRDALFPSKRLNDSLMPDYRFVGLV